jgi:hypothetical protein
MGRHACHYAVRIFEIDACHQSTLREALQITLNAVFGWIISLELAEKRKAGRDHIDAYDGKTQIRYLAYLSSKHPRRRDWQ